MRNIHSSGEYNSYKNTSGGSGGGYGPGCGGLIGIIIAVILIISFIANGASWEAIETLLAFIIIAFMIFK